MLWDTLEPVTLKELFSVSHSTPKTCLWCIVGLDLNGAWAWVVLGFYD